MYTYAHSSLQNVLVGKMYIENFGSIYFSNLSTGDTGVLELKKRGWNDKNAYETIGVIKNKEGKLKYTL